MPTKPTLLYWDSCVFISAIQQSQGHYPTLKTILDYAAAEKILITTSALTIAEVVKIERNGDGSVPNADDATKIRLFFENDYLAIWNVDRLLAEQACEIVRQHGVKPADAIHIATALRSGAACLQTYDKRLLGLDGRIGWPTLAVKVPSHPEAEVIPMLF